MPAIPAPASAAPAVTAQDLELEHAELLPARETLWITRLYPRYPGGPVYPGGSVMHYHPNPPLHFPQ
jgi:hypothetical protein